MHTHLGCLTVVPGNHLPFRYSLTTRPSMAYCILCCFCLCVCLCVHTCIFMFLYTCVCVCVCIYMYLVINAYFYNINVTWHYIFGNIMYKYLCALLICEMLMASWHCVNTCLYMLCVYIYVYIYIYTYIYIYIYIYIHISH